MNSTIKIKKLNFSLTSDYNQSIEITIHYHSFDYWNEKLVYGSFSTLRNAK
jgi:hypothetical protein